jgi:hypothetical protein
MKWSIYITWVLLLFWGSSSLAQNLKRVEIPVRNTPDQYAVIPVGSSGVVAFTEIEKGRFSFSRYDTSLTTLWTVDCYYNRNMSLLDYTYHDQYLYLLMGYRRGLEYQVIRLSVAAGFAEKFDFRSLKDLDLTDFKAVGHEVYLAARAKTEPLLLHTNLISRKTRVLPAAFKGKTQIQSIEIDRQTGQVNVAFANNYKNEYKVIIRSYGREGEHMKSSTVVAPDEKRLMTGRLSSLNETEEFVMGTYGLKRSRQEYTQGLYITKLIWEKISLFSPAFTVLQTLKTFSNFNQSGNKHVPSAG